MSYAQFVIWRPFCLLAAILFFGSHFVFQKKSKFVWTVYTNFHAKSGLCSSRVSELCSICDLAVILFLEFVWTVHTNFHTKSGLCSSRNEQVMFNLVFGAEPCCRACDQPTYRAARFAPANNFLSTQTKILFAYLRIKHTNLHF